jgi:hypothetical protein
MDRREDRVAGDDGQLIVEGDIGADEFRRVSHRGGIDIERPLEPPDILIGRDLGRLPGNACLE